MALYTEKTYDQISPLISRNNYKTTTYPTNLVTNTAANTKSSNLLEDVLGGIGNAIGNVGKSVVGVIGTGGAAVGDLLGELSGEDTINSSKYVEGKNQDAFKKWLYGTDENGNADYANAAGSALDAASTVAGFIPGVAGAKGLKAVATNAGLGAMGGAGNAMAQGGSLEDILSGAGAGALAGGTIGGVNSKMTNKMVANGGNLINGNNALTRNANKIASSNIGRGALSGALGGSIAGGTMAGLNGEDILSGAAGGALTGGLTGGIASGAISGASRVGGKAANAISNKVDNSPKTLQGFRNSGGNKTTEQPSIITPESIAQEAQTNTSVAKATQSDIAESSQRLRDAKAEGEREAAAKNLLSQVGTISKPAAKANNMINNTMKFMDRGLTKAEEWKVASDAITGRNGKLSELYTRIMNTAGAVDTTTGLNGKTLTDTIDDLIRNNGMKGTSDEKAIRSEIEGVLEMLPSRRDGTITGLDDAADVMDAVRNLEAKRRNYLGESGTNYSTTTPYKEQKARVLNGVATILEDKIYDNVPDISSVITPEVTTELKNIFPNNKKWADYIDNDIATIKTGKELRAAQKPYVQMSNGLKAADENFGTYGQRVGDFYGNIVAESLSKVPVVGGIASNFADSPWLNRQYAKIHSAKADYLENPNTNPNAPRNITNNQSGASVGTNQNGTSTTSNPSGSQTTNTPTNKVIDAYSKFKNSGIDSSTDPAMALYNLIGRAEANQQVADSTAANSIANAMGLSGQEYADNMASVPNTTSSANIASGYTTGTTNSGATSTGTGASGTTAANSNSTLNTIAKAIELAVAAGDGTAVSKLAEMYSTLAEIYGTNSNSYSNLTTAEKNQIAKLNTAEDAITNLEDLYASAGGGQGMVGGNVTNFLGSVGLNSNASAYNQMSEGLINQIAAAVGKTDALNTEGEVQRALSLVPKLTDTAETASIKLAELRKMLSDTKSTYSQVYGVSV